MYGGTPMTLTGPLEPIILGTQVVYFLLSSGTDEVNYFTWGQKNESAISGGIETAYLASHRCTSAAVTFSKNFVSTSALLLGSLMNVSCSFAVIIAWTSLLSIWSATMVTAFRDNADKRLLVWLIRYGLGCDSLIVTLVISPASLRTEYVSCLSSAGLKGRSNVGSTSSVYNMQIYCLPKWKCWLILSR